MKSKLPIGIQTFRKIREDDCYYVDKTVFIRQLIDRGQHFFLSRPRRFGKSLLLDTIKELFEGNEALFRGLAIHDQWRWIRHPVVRISFGAGNFAEPGYLQEDMDAQLADLEAQAGIQPRAASTPIRFRQLIKALHDSGRQRVAVLVDEYDKPILDALEVPEIARANRDFLRGIYSVVKDCDADIAFSLLTGVSKFSKVSLFSGLNNLTDITLDPAYSAICGYTDADLDAVFAPELPGLDRDEIRRWYNGYSWLGDEKVYNPFDLLLLFSQRRFRAHWFETGSPKFLIDALLRHRFPTPNLDGMTGSEALLSAFDVDEMSLEALLFQTGYLTIVDEEDAGGRIRYRLGYPNHEVRQSLNERLLIALLPDAVRREADDAPLRALLAANDFAGLEGFLRSLFAAIPYQWHVNNNIQDYEGYYASVVYSCFASHGFDLVAEESTSAGRADMVLRFDGAVYVFEFKSVAQVATGQALAQIKGRGYAEKYRHLGQPVHLIGVEFSKAERNIAAFDVVQDA